MSLVKIPALALALLLQQQVERIPTHNFNRWHQGEPDERVPWPERNVILYPVQMAQLKPPAATTPATTPVDAYDLEYHYKSWRVRESANDARSVYDLGWVHSTHCPKGMRFRMQFLIGEQMFFEEWECDAHQHLRPPTRKPTGERP